MSPQIPGIMDTAVGEKFASYPEPARTGLLFLRKLILETALETEGVERLEETLKWGEPSYSTAGGSTVRIDWKARSPERIAMFFHCQSKLIDTFRELHGDVLQFEGNRAILVELGGEMPVQELKHCVALCLRYHRIKHLPLLGT